MPGKLQSITPLSPVQEGMLFEAISHASGQVHLEQVCLELTGVVHVETLKLALADLVKRHPMLRTGFVWKNQPSPLQVTLADPPLPFHFFDWTQDFKLQLLQDLKTRRLQEGLPLNKPPLMRMDLCQTAPEHFFFLWTYHHLLMDGWCLKLLLADFLALYTQMRTGTPSSLSHGRPYTEFIHWLNHQDQETARSFWEETFKTFSGPTLPGNILNSVSWADTKGTATFSLQVSPEASQSLTQAMQAQRYTLNTLAQAAFTLFLAHLGDTWEVTFGTTVSGRPPEHHGFNQTVGLFINTLPVRMIVSATQPIAKVLEQIQSYILQIRDFEYISSKAIRSWTEIPGGQKLFESLFVFENYPSSQSLQTAHGFQLQLSEEGYSGGRTGFPFSLLFTPGKTIGLHLMMDKARMDASQGQQLLQAYHDLLFAMALESSKSVAAVLKILENLPRPSFYTPSLAQVSQDSSADNVPTTDTEVRVAQIWGDLLGLSTVGFDIHFFQMGGHSLLAAQLMASLSQTFRTQLPLALLIENPTLRQLAKAIDAFLQGDEQTPLHQSTLEPDLIHRFQPFPLNDVQQAYWIGRSGDFLLGNVATHSYIEFESDWVDLQRFENVWQALIQRHEMLRAVVLPTGQQQLLSPSPTFHMQVTDYSNLPASARDRQLADIRSQLSHKVHHPGQWPLFDIRVSLLGKRLARFHVGYDFLICDAWSFQIISREIGILYHNPKVQLPALSLSFRDYVLAEKQLANGQAYEKALDFWKTQAATMPGGPDLPLAVHPEQLGTPRFHRRTSRLDAERWSILKARAAKKGLTPSGFMLAVFSEVLSVWSTTSEFTLNLTFFNRMPLHPEVHQVVGDFTSLLLLKIDAATYTGFTDFAKAIQADLWRALDNRLVSGVRVLREMNRGRVGQERQIMPVVFTSTLTLPNQEQTQVGLFDQLKPVYSIGQTPQVWLDNQVTEREGNLVFWWDSVDGLFPAGMLDAMFEAYTHLLKTLAEDESCWDCRPDLIPPLQSQARNHFNQSAVSLPPGLLHLPFFQNAQAHPQRLAILSKEVTLTYAELQSMADAYAQLLVARGIQSEDRVGVLLLKGWQQAVACLAILRAGGAYVPIHPDTPKERLHYLLTDCRIGCVLTTQELAETAPLPDSCTAIPIYHFSEAAFPSTSHLVAASPQIRPEHLAYIIYTSGSTGKPKGVAIDHRAAYNTLLDMNQRFAVSHEDRVFAISSLQFDLSVYDIFGTLAAGAAIVYPEAELEREPEHWLTCAENFGVTLWNSVPAFVEMLLTTAGKGAAQRLNTLKMIWMSGDWIGLELVARLKKFLPDVKIISLGGATEAAVWSIFYPVGALREDWTSIPYGKPLGNQQWYVLDEHQRQCPDWVTGDLYIGGIGLARNYWNDAEKTDAAFITHRKTGARLYRTGDTGRFQPDGFIEFQGRRDFQVKVQGHRIELGEIEAALLKHAAVREAVVCALGPPRGAKTLVAYLVAASVAPASLADWLQEWLPDYMIPKNFVFLQRFPLTANGKVDRKQLPAPEKVGEPNTHQVHIPPDADLILDQVVHIWETTLGLGSLDPHENLFSLGGDSLAAVRIVAQVNDCLNAKLTLRDLFAHPTAVGLTQQLRSKKTRRRTLRPRGESHTSRLPLSFSQMRLWFSYVLNPGDSAFNIPGAMRFIGKFSTHHLQTSIQQILMRHEVLRATFYQEQGEAYMAITPYEPLELPVLDLSAEPHAMDHAIAWVTAQAQGRFDLEKGPAYRFCVLRLSETDHLLYFNFHHIVGDAWSLDLLTQELKTGYLAALANTSPDYPCLTCQYPDYALAQREWSGEDAFTDQLHYWKQQLADLSPLYLPKNDATGTALTPCERQVRWNPSLSLALQDLAKSNQSTLYMLLLSLFYTVLYSETGQRDLVVATSTADRNEQAVMPLIGCFVNLLLMRTQLQPHWTFLEFLQRVRRLTTDAYLNRDLPFERLVWELNPSRDPDRFNQLFQILFVLENTHDTQLELPGLEVSSVPFPRNLVRHELNIHFTQTSTGLLGSVHFSTHQFPVQYVDALLFQMKCAADTVLKNPTISLQVLAEELRTSLKNLDRDALRQRKKASRSDLKKLLPSRS